MREPQVKLAGGRAFQTGGQQAEIHIVGRGVARFNAHLHLVIALDAHKAHHLGLGEKFDARVIPDALELDFQPAGGGTEFGEIFVELSHAAAQPGRLFDDEDVVPQFRRFNGGCEARKAAAHDENGIGHPGYPPALLHSG